jgi:hypothetical protein
MSEAHRRGSLRDWARTRAAATILPSDLKALRSRSGPFKPALVALAAQAAEQREQLLEALGGRDRVSPQRQALVEDAAALGLLARALLLRFAQTEDAELASRVATLLSARRASLQAVGLEEHREELTLAEYLAQRDRELEAAQDRAHAPNVGRPDGEAVPDREPREGPRP